MSGAPQSCRIAEPGAVREQPQRNEISTDFLGISEYGDDRQRLYVASGRSLIAYNTAKATETGGSYRPPADLRRDIVSIDCGDSDLGELFECARVRVTPLDKRPVKPISYKAGPAAYKNALGARWTVREVMAVFSAKDLADGFVVEYSDFNGTDWTLNVSPEDAAEKLLLKVTARDTTKEQSHPRRDRKPALFGRTREPERRQPEPSVLCTRRPNSGNLCGEVRRNARSQSLR